LFIQIYVDFCKWNKSANLEPGQACTFLDLAKATYAALGTPLNITFVDTPINIRDKYWYCSELFGAAAEYLEFEHDTVVFALKKTDKYAFQLQICPKMNTFEV
jgi:hypothetical protein